LIVFAAIYFAMTTIFALTIKLFEVRTPWR